MRRRARDARVALGVALLVLVVLVGGAGASAKQELLAQQLEAILLRPDVAERTRRLSALLLDLGPADLAVEREVQRSLNSHTGAVEAVLFASWWAGFDPEGALEAIRSGDFGDQAGTALRAVLRSWAWRDPLTARDHLLARPTGQPMELALPALVQGWAESGRDDVWGFVEELGVGAARQDAIALLADDMVLRRGPEAAVRFVEALPDAAANRFKLQAFRRVAAALVLRDPELAAAWAEQHLAGPFGDGLLRHVVGRWAHDDGRAALSWLAGLDPSPAQSEAIGLAFSLWMRRAPGEAAEWIEAQPASAALDPALALHAASLAGRDGPGAVALLDRIGDPQHRAWTALNIGRAWLRSDRDAALAWIERADLDPDLREKILEPPRPRPGRRAPAAPSSQAVAGDAS